MTVRGARPRSPAATSSAISATVAEALLERRPVLEVGGLAQPSRRPGRRACPTRPAASASLNASTWCSPGASRNGSEVPISRWSKPPRICSSSQAISPSSSIERWSGSSTRAARESTTTSRAWVSKSRA